MELSTRAVKDFRRIYKVEPGLELSDVEAAELAYSFADLMRIVYRPLSIEGQRRALGKLLMQLLVPRMHQLSGYVV